MKRFNSKPPQTRMAKLKCSTFLPHNYGPEDGITLRARATYYFLQVCAHLNFFHRVSHVCAHCGIRGNELADFIAGNIRTGGLPSRPLPRHYAHWFQGNPPKILHAGPTMDFVIRPNETPILDGTRSTFPLPTLPASRPNWLPQLPTTNTASTDGGSDTFPPLMLAIYNVHNLKRHGCAAYLREQLEAKNIFMIRLQETRIPSAETFDTSYLRFCGPALQGQFWISQCIPYACRGKTPVYVRRNDEQVLRADPEC